MADSPSWTEPGAFEVAPGVHRIPLPLPQDALRAVNVYAIESHEGLALVDAGWSLPESWEQLALGLKQVGHEIEEISHCLVTHIHRDHYTQAMALRRELGTKVLLGAGEQQSISALRRADLSVLNAQLAQLRQHGAEAVVRALQELGYGGKPDPAQWELPDDWMAGRSTISLGDRDLLALPTPGHTQGHVVFSDLQNGLLFAGDHVLPHITPSIGFEPVSGALPLRDYLDSLSTVRELPDLRLLPAHGPVTDSVHRRVDELVAHHADRLEACRAVLSAGAETAYQVARRLRWTRRERAFDELDPFNQMLATAETAAHLDLLAAQGKLQRGADGDAIVRYATASSPPSPS